VSRSGAAIVREPKAFLMDEPLGTLDAEFRELMCVELRKLHERLKTTTVFVTHDQNEAMALADHIVVMNNGDILQADDPHRHLQLPSCVFVARFIGRPPMNLLDVRGAVGAGASPSAGRWPARRRADRRSTRARARSSGVRPRARAPGVAGRRVWPAASSASSTSARHWIAECRTDAAC
jgi:multiple sugar transport system ATP-binding protein